MTYGPYQPAKPQLKLRLLRPAFSSEGYGVLSAAGKTGGKRKAVKGMRLKSVCINEGADFPGWDRVTNVTDY